MGRLLGYDRFSALRYSFLLAIPAVLASGLNELSEAISGAPSAFSLSETFVATIVAFLVGYTVIAWLMKFISTRSFAPFVLYRVLLGLTLLGLLAIGVVNK
jgi:undecaprenyl-diphosphatase